MVKWRHSGLGGRLGMMPRAEVSEMENSVKPRWELSTI